MAHSLVHRFGVVSTPSLIQLGWSNRAIARAVAAGDLKRLRRGWLARVGADEQVAAAVQSGGCLSCADALRLHGVWVPERVGAGHVRFGRRARAEGAQGCRARGVDPPVLFAVDDVETAFRCFLRCASAEDVTVVVDSLRHLQLATPHEVASWAANAPQRIQAAVARSERAESGLETMVRVRLRARNIEVTPQVWIDGMRVDLLVGKRLVIECDGGEHHSSWQAQAADRWRDRRLLVLGFQPVRLTYRQIVEGWDAVERDLLTMIRRKDHRGPARMCV